MNRAEFFANQRSSWPIDSGKESFYDKPALSKVSAWTMDSQKKEYFESSTQNTKYWPKGTVINVEPEGGFQPIISYYKSEYVVGAPKSKKPNTKIETAAENDFDANLNSNPGPVTFPPTDRVTKQSKQIIATIPRTRTRFRYRNHKIIASSSRPKFGNFKLTTSPTVSKIRNKFQLTEIISNPLNTSTINKSSTAINDFEAEFSGETDVLNLDSKKLSNVSKPFVFVPMKNDSFFDLLNSTATLEPPGTITVTESIIVPNTESSYMEEKVDFMLNVDNNNVSNNETNRNINLIDISSIMIINQTLDINSSFVNDDDIFKEMAEALQTKNIAKLKELAARLNSAPTQSNAYNNDSSNSIVVNKALDTAKPLNRGRSSSKRLNIDLDQKAYVAPRVRSSRLNRGRKLTHSP